MNDPGGTHCRDDTQSPGAHTLPVLGDGGWGEGGKNVGVIPAIKELLAEDAKHQSRNS